MSMNKVTLIGRLGRNVELKKLPSGKSVASLSLATTEKWKDKKGVLSESTSWHKVVAWGGLAITASEKLSKGDQVCIEGKIITRSWETKNKEKKYTTEIITEKLIFLNSSSSEKEEKEMATQSQINEAIAFAHVDL